MYAAKTDVPVRQSRIEIGLLLVHHGAKSFAYGWEEDKAAISFTLASRRLRFIIPLPKREEFAAVRPGARKRTAETIDRAYEQACRSRHRALLLILKAKLEAIKAGAVTFEDEFLGNIVLPEGPTVGDWLRPQLAIGYREGRMPALPASDGHG